MRYLISYDLMKPGKNYDALWAALKEIGAKRVLESEWLVKRINTNPLSQPLPAIHGCKRQDSSD